MFLLWATRIALLLAAASAVALARRRADHRPFAAFLVWLVIVNTVRALLSERFGLIRPLGSPPFTGAARAAFHVDEAGELSSAAAFAALTILLFARRRWLSLLPAIAWLGAFAYLVTHYPEVRGDPLRQVYLAAELAALAVAVLSFGAFWRRREPMTLARTCTLVCLLVDGGTLFIGAWRWGFWTAWNLQQGAYLVMYSIITTLQVLSWSSFQSPSR
jgi:hypothetical protein